MSVKLINYSQDTEGRNVLEQIAYCARVSNPSNQNNNETAEKLVRYLIKNKHFSPLEMVSACLEINTTRDIARQILRHRSFSFQEFCLSGDTEIYFSIPRKLKDGKYKPTQKIKLKDLWDKWENGAKPINVHGTPVRIPLKDRIKNMHIKCYDENTNQLTTAHIKNVFKTGIKDIFEITLDDGKKIKTTKEHKFLTSKGFDSLENIVGLSHYNDKVVMTIKEPIIGVNGIPLYQDKNWLSEIKKNSIFEGGGISWIVQQYGYKYSTLRKWLRKHNIHYTKKEVSIICPVWNKGKFGYKTKPHSIETRRKMQESALARGENHNWYRGGNSKKREPLDAIDVKEFRKKNDYTGWQNIGSKIRKQNAYTVKWQKIKSIVYIGKEETYDLEIDHDSHNYIANGIVVHNSQRYANPIKELNFVTREARLQDEKNRQNSIEIDDDYLKHRWKEEQESVIKAAKQAYEWAIRNGIAKEQARTVLPEGNIESKIYMNGTIRSWLHYIQLRSANGTQKEHREIAIECAKAIEPIFPMINEFIEK